MSFWDLSDGEKANENASTEYETGGGQFDPIPNDTDALADVKAVKWQTKGEGADAVRFIEVQWSVQKPEQFANRTVFQKLWVADLDPSAKSEDKAKEKRDKARRMLATIDANAKGQLLRSSDTPTDDSLALALQGASMVIKIMEWGMTGNDGSWMSGNWVSAVKPKDAELKVGKALERKGADGPRNQSTPSGSGTGGGFDLDDEIPFAPEWRA